MGTWQRIGVCPDWQCAERLWHAGLSDDGTKCFVAGIDDNYVVWDIDQQAVVWRNDRSDVSNENRPLEAWVNQDGYIVLEGGAASARYRIFGLHVDFARIESERLKLFLEVDEQLGYVILRDTRTWAETCTLEFDAFSGDWAIASFSENDEVIAVIEPYSVTFFRHSQALEI